MIHKKKHKLKILESLLEVANSVDYDEVWVKLDKTAPKREIIKKMLGA